MDPSPAETVSDHLDLEMKPGDLVRTEIELPGIPVGTCGIVREVGRVFVVVQFEDGRQGYYARRQLSIVSPSGEGRHERPSVALGIGRARVPMGSHVCLFAPTTEGAVGAVARWMACGLRQGEMVVCAAPKGWSRGVFSRLSQLSIDGRAAERRGQLNLVPMAEAYLPRERFCAKVQLQMVAPRLEQLCHENPQGVRCLGVTGDMHLADEWWEYEEGLNPLLGKLGVTALCVYHGQAADGEVGQRAISCHTHVLRGDVLSAGGL